jgi:hypothetical protein
MSACQPVTKGRTIKSTKSSATAFRGKHHIQTFKEYSLLIQRKPYVLQNKIMKILKHQHT